MQDFAPEARQNYQGWFNAEKINRDSQVNTAQKRLNEVDPYYQTLFDELGGNQKKSQEALTSSMIRRGVFRSGVMTQAEGNLAGEYGKMNTRLGEEKRQKKDEYTGVLDTATKLRDNLNSELEDKVNALARQLYNTWISQENEKASIAAQAKSNSNYSTTGGDAFDYNDGLSDLGAVMFKTGMTREQAAAQLARDAGRNEQAVLKDVYKTYGDNWEMPWYKKNRAGYGFSLGNGGGVNARYKAILGQQSGGW